MAKPRQSVQKRIREEKKRDRERRKREKATLKAERREGKDSGGSESEQDDPGQVDPRLQTGESAGTQLPDDKVPARVAIGHHAKMQFIFLSV